MCCFNFKIDFYEMYPIFAKCFLKRQVMPQLAEIVHMSQNSCSKLEKKLEKHVFKGYTKVRQKSVLILNIFVNFSVNVLHELFLRKPCSATEA